MFLLLDLIGLSLMKSNLFSCGVQLISLSVTQIPFIVLGDLPMFTFLLAIVLTQYNHNITLKILWHNILKIMIFTATRHYI